MWAKRPVSVWAATSETITSGQAASAWLTAWLSGSDTTGLVPMIQTALTSPRPMAANSSTAVSPGSAPAVPSPEAGQPLQIVWHKIHVRRQHRRQPADFAAAHGVGLTGQRKGAAAAAAILPAGQMDVDDGVTFVAAAGGLIDSHGVEGDRPRGGDELAIESRHLIGRQTAKAATLATSQPRAAASACGPSRKPSTQAPASARGVKQPRKQPAVASRGQREMAVGDLAGSGASGVDRHAIRNRGLSRFACASRWNSTGCAQAAFEPTSTTRSLFSTSS